MCKLIWEMITISSDLFIFFRVKVFDDSGYNTTFIRIFTGLKAFDSFKCYRKIHNVHTFTLNAIVVEIAQNIFPLWVEAKSIWKPLSSN